MSSIPTKAIPQAGTIEDIATDTGDTVTLAQRVKDQAGRVATLARDNPKAAIAAGAAVVAAAAAIPLVKSRRAKANGTTKTGSKAPSRTKTKAS